jgi:DNA modification methylase
MRKDSSWSRPAMADYVLIFRKPGENIVPVQPDITNDLWIEWARPIWYGIRESDTLRVAEARDSDDERHICPLQLGTIERCIRLWSNPGETVLSPFAGIGSEGYEAIRLGRKFIGFELKPSYAQAAAKNLRAAVAAKNQGELFIEEETSA